MTEVMVYMTVQVVVEVIMQIKVLKACGGVSQHRFLFGEGGGRSHNGGIRRGGTRRGRFFRGGIPHGGTCVSKCRGESRHGSGSCGGSHGGNHGGSRRCCGSCCESRGGIHGISLGRNCGRVSQSCAFFLK